MSSKPKDPAYAKAYYAAHRDVILARSRAYARDNPEKVKENSRRFYWENRERILAKKRAAYRENREELLRKQKERRIRTYLAEKQAGKGGQHAQGSIDQAAANRAGDGGDLRKGG